LISRAKQGTAVKVAMCFWGAGALCSLTALGIFLVINWPAKAQERRD
jgi:hypothetical protein